MIKWYAAIAAVWLWDKLSPRRRVFAYHVQKYRDKATRRDGAVGGEPMDPEWFREDFARADRAAARGQDPPGRRRAPAAVRSAPRARAARERGVQGKARAGAVMALDVRTGLVTQVAPAGAPGAQRARYLPIAEHGLIGDLHTVALVGTDGTIDWYCCPRFDSPSVFAAILDADRGGLFRDRARRRRVDLQAALPARHQHPHHALPDARRGGGGAGLHAPARHRRGGAPPPHDPPGARGPRADALRRRRRPALRLRARPPRGRAHRARRALPLSRAGARPVDALPARGRRRPRRPRARRAPGRGDGHLRARPRRARRDAGAVLRCRHRRRVRRHRGVLAALAAPLALQRALARDGASLGAHAQAAHLRAHRRDRGRPHHQPARAARRRPQLGLPLHVDARRRVLALRPAQARVHRRGRRVHAMAGGALPPRGRPRIGPAADHVRHRRARGPARGGALAPGGLHGLGAGADRQRGGDPAAARHLRRADGLRLSLQQVRAADLPRRLDASSRATSSG